MLSGFEQALDEVRVLSKFPRGIVNVPPSKSQAHRAIICAFLSRGRSLLGNISLSRDVAATLGGISAMGGAWRAQGDCVAVEGIGGAGSVIHARVPCGESASTLRFLLPVAAALGITAEFRGEPGLLRRPVCQYEKLFARHGAQLEYFGGGVRVGGKLRPGVYALDGKVSSQFVSGLLMALPLLGGDSEIVVERGLESAAYVDMTRGVCARFGVTSRAQGYAAFAVPGGQQYRAAVFSPEGDYSQAAYFLAAGALGADVACAGLPAESLQADRAIVDILRGMGAAVAALPGGVLQASAEGLHGAQVDVSQHPDIAPPIAALMCLARGTSRIVGAARLRLKESDRLGAVADALGGLGADIREVGDTLVIRGRPSLRGGAANARGDHRIAMMTALAAIKCEGAVRLTGWRCVDKSYPAFWRDWEKEC